MHELDYVNETSVSRRKKFGQYFTPEIIADLMVSWVIQDNPSSLLDPAFGLGVFYDALLCNKKINGRLVNYSAYEIDSHILDYLNSHGASSPAVEISDYLQTEKNKYDAIVCNPPYMRFQNFLNRHDVLLYIEKNLGIKLNGYSNIASVFLVKSLRELNEGGRLAYIMPFEFFNTGYGENIKKELLKNGLLKQIVFFCNEKDIFSDAVTTVCILLCKNDAVSGPIKISRVDSLEQLNSIDHLDEFFQHELPSGSLPFNKKWSPLIASRYWNFKIPERMSRIAEYGKFVRGIATGANEYFALNKDKVEALKIGLNNTKKCITKSSQIKKLVFTEDDYVVLASNGAAVFCFNAMDRNDKNVANYLQYGVSKGFDGRYLTKHRTPWYKLESRSPAPVLAGVFNRGGLKVVRNFTDAINFTCFHSFYPNIFGADHINRLFVYLMSDTGQNILMTNKRQYGDGLDKFEPGDLNECYCPSVKQFDKVSDFDALKVIELAENNESEAIAEANILVERMLNDLPSKKGTGLNDRFSANTDQRSWSADASLAI